MQWLIHVSFSSHRHKLISGTSCNITLLTELKREDNNRKWRCQVSSRKNSRLAFLDFTSPFVFQNPLTAQNPPSSSIDGPVQLPISRIALCVALPVMVLIVGFFTCREGPKQARASATGIKLQGMNWLFITVSVFLFFFLGGGGFKVDVSTCSISKSLRIPRLCKHVVTCCVLQF